MADKGGVPVGAPIDIRKEGPSPTSHGMQSSDNNELVKTDYNAKVVLIPGGCISLVQPMDKCDNEPFKKAMWILGGVDEKAKGPY